MKKRFGISFLLAWLLIACQTTTPPTLPPAATATPLSLPTSPVLADLPPTFTPMPEATATPTPTVTAEPTATSEPTSTPTPSATPSPTPTATPTLDLILPQLTPNSRVHFSVLNLPPDLVTPFHEAILFTSSSRNPFEPAASAPVAENSFVNSSHELWGISADGQTRTFLADTTNGQFVYYTAGQTKPFKVLDIWGGSEYNPDITEMYPAPGECEGIFPAGEQPFTDAGSTAFGCEDFNNSPDGRYVSMYFQPDNCGRGLIILDMATGQTIYRTVKGSHYLEFWGNEYAFITVGACHGGSNYLINLANGSLKQLGEGGYLTWNPQRTAFMVEVVPYSAIVGQLLIGYNFEQQQHFLPELPINNDVASRPRWVDDGTHVIYQYQAVTEDAPYIYSLQTPNKLIVMNASTGEIVAELNDPFYNYFITEEPWRSDWLPINRFPFTVETNVDVYNTNCSFFGKECSQAGEKMGYNWRTGELLAWADVPVPTTTPAPTVAPDLSQPPLYQHPSGDYALYVGTNGRTLWVVPRLGEPFIWVYDGQNFTYIP